jgi:hypothetical protein
MVIWRQLHHPNILQLFGVDATALTAHMLIRIVMPHFRSVNLKNLVIGSVHNQLNGRSLVAVREPLSAHRNPIIDETQRNGTRATHYDAERDRMKIVRLRLFTYGTNRLR